MIKVGIIGATGYAGAELVRLLVGASRGGDCLVWFQKLCGSELYGYLPQYVYDCGGQVPG